MLPPFFRSLQRRLSVNNLTPPQRMERYQRLIDISRDLASTLDIDILLSRIVQVAADLSDSEEASILLYDHIREVLYFEAATNINQPYLKGQIVPVEESIAGWIVKNRHSITLPEASIDERHFNHIAEITGTQTKTLLGIPLINKDIVVGVLEAINKRSGQFTDEDLDVLTILGAQAAVAIENARLFQQSDLIAELVHELRTPMASLSTAVQILLRPEISEQQHTKLVEIIHDEINRLSDLTTAFLDLARLESGRMQFHYVKVNIKSLIEYCIEIMHGRAAEKNISISFELADESIQIHADRDKIIQVMLNLLSNAIKYNHEGGKIVVKANENPKNVVISLADTGSGISPESLPHLFHKFYRVPGMEKTTPGTGLGLSICKRIIETHGGIIEVQSTLGKGSTITIYLPRLKE
jgi:signal transduction histidine kinase